MVLPGLKRWREQAVLTQAELAQRSGVSRGSITRLENGGRAHPAIVRRLAKALKCTARDLMEP